MTHFNGPEYDPKTDDPRLRLQHERIKKLMMEHKWLTLGEIENATEAPQASISTQIRHLRKVRFGGYVMERRPRGDRKRGLFEYRLMPPGHESQWVHKTQKGPLRRALEAIWRHPDTTEAQKQVILEITKKRKKIDREEMT